MQKINGEYLTGERALFFCKDSDIEYCTFADGESPLKESRNINISHSMFKWKYPIWYSHNVNVKNSTLFETARSGIWYTHDIKIEDSLIEAPKTFRRSSGIKLKNVDMPNASETLWSCDDISLENVNAHGDYFGMNSSNINVNNLRLTGNYSFDGGKNIEIHNSVLISKDSLWNVENANVYDSFISGEYLGWNSKNLTFINCTIESLQGLCYIENLKMVNCKLINTTLAFEYVQNVDADIVGHVDSIKNPISGRISLDSVGELVMEDNRVDVTKTRIEIRGKQNV